MTPATSKNLASKVAAGFVVVIIVATFFSLGIWQLNRAAALKASLVTATTIDEKTVALDSIATVNTSLTPTALNRMVKVSGHYVADFKAPGQVDSSGKLADWEVGLLQVNP